MRCRAPRAGADLLNGSRGTRGPGAFPRPREGEKALIDPKTRKYLHIAVVVVGLWFIVKGVAGLMGYDLEAMVSGVLP